MLDGEYGALEDTVFYKSLAIKSCINLIASTFSKAEFLTFEKGKEVKKDNYYLFNVKPNQNLSSSEFWRKAIHKLYIENELLIVQVNDNFYIADDFNVENRALKENIYSCIQIDNYSVSDIFLESDVFHLELNNSNVKNTIDGLFQTYSKLIAAGHKNYIDSKKKRGVLNVPLEYPQTLQAQNELKDLMENKFKTFFQSDKDTVLPLTNGMKYEELGINNKGKSVGEVRDVRAYIDDIFDFTGIAFNVPPELIKGKVAEEKTINNYFMFCINTLAKFVTDEINMKFYSKKDYLEKTYMKVDTSRIRVTSLKDIANSLDILTRSGANTINDNLRALDREPLNNEVGNKRYMTKNYEELGKTKEN